MEKQLSALGYWLGLICTVLAVILRLLIAIHVNPPLIGAPGGTAISPCDFLSWCRAVFLAGDCELVPDCKVLG